MGSYIKVIVLEIGHFFSKIADEYNISESDLDQLTKIKASYPDDKYTCILLHM